MIHILLFFYDTMTENRLDISRQTGMRAGRGQTMLAHGITNGNKT